MNKRDKCAFKFWCLGILCIFIIFSLFASMDNSILTSLNTLFKDAADITRELTLGNGDNLDVANVLYFLTGFTTAILALIAYYNFKYLNQINKNKQLLQIDQRWGNHEIIKARQIIHIIYRTVCDILKYEDSDGTLSLCPNIYPKVGRVIVELSVSKEPAFRKAFVYLLNYLDLMESLAFIYKDADVNEIDELEAFSGETLVFNYGIFYDYIKFKNMKHSIKGYNATEKKKFYNQYEKLMYNVLKNKQTDEQDAYKQKHQHIECIISDHTIYPLIKNTKKIEHPDHTVIKEILKDIKIDVTDLLSK